MLNRGLQIWSHLLPQLFLSHLNSCKPPLAPSALTTPPCVLMLLCWLHLFPLDTGLSLAWYIHLPAILTASSLLLFGLCLQITFLVRSTSITRIKMGPLPRLQFRVAFLINFSSYHYVFCWSWRTSETTRGKIKWRRLEKTVVSVGTPWTKESGINVPGHPGANTKDQLCTLKFLCHRTHVARALLPVCEASQWRPQVPALAVYKPEHSDSLEISK